MRRLFTTLALLAAVALGAFGAGPAGASVPGATVQQTGDVQPLTQAGGIGIAGWYAAGRAYRMTSADSTQYSGYVRDGDHADGHCAYMEWKDQTGVWRETGFYNLGAGGSLGTIENPFVNCTTTNKSWVRSGSAASYNDVTGLRMGVTGTGTKYVFCDTATECRTIPTS